MRDKCFLFVTRVHILQYVLQYFFIVTKITVGSTTIDIDGNKRV